MKQLQLKESPNHSPFGSIVYAVAEKHWQYIIFCA